MSTYRERGVCKVNGGTDPEEEDETKNKNRRDQGKEAKENDNNNAKIKDMTRKENEVNNILDQLEPSIKQIRKRGNRNRKKSIK